MTFTLLGDDASSFVISDAGVLSFAAQPVYSASKSSLSFTLRATDAGGKAYNEDFVVNIEEVADPTAFKKSFQINTSASSDANLVDYIATPDDATTQEEITALDLTFQNGVIEIPAVSMDVVNIQNSLSGVEGSGGSAIKIPLSFMPAIDVPGGIEETVYIRIFDDADGNATKDASDRLIELSFKIKMTGSVDANGDAVTFGISPVTGAEALSVKYQTSELALTLAEDSSSAISFIEGATSSDPSMLSISPFDLLVQVQESTLVREVLGLNVSNVLAAESPLRMEVSGLPVLDGSGASVSKIAGTINLVDKNALPVVELDPVQHSTALSIDEDGASFIDIHIDASDLEGADLTYSVPEDLSLQYGTSFTLHNAENGIFRYTLNNDNAVVSALGDASAPLEEVVSVQVTDGVTTSTLELSIAINGANDKPENVTLTPPTGDLIVVEENSPGAVIGVLSADDDEGDEVTFRLANPTEDNLFEIVTVDGNPTLKLKAGSFANYEVNENHNYIVEVRADDGTDVEDAAFTINTQNVEESAISYFTNN
jgi:VCBS repeat-containing protein